MKMLPILTLVTSGLMSLTAFATAPNFPHLVTTGYGEVQATPDMAEFTVRVVETTMTAEQAKQSVDTVVDDFIAQLSQHGVTSESINSSNLYLTPQYHYPKKGKPELVGYRASRTVTVKVDDLTKLNQYLDVALNEGINQVDAIRLKVRDESRYQQQARLAAIKDANAKAKSLAQGFEQEIGGVWRIDYNMPSTQPVLMRSMSMDAKAESNSYQDSTLVIRDRVDVIYKLENE
ncbi:oxidative stress defense protein [Vibrio genomosp. F10]|uniref:Oxidative stress defense protein n=2 Tax=Vibrio genomosp. F10 TaxID=723171 RepID=A0A1B9QWB3_9VIBR|nr:oxidative stress defense protein [Vibrio genomosp. F10]OCH73854.1 oxidative stress defense protein [Vibrio genomosp. F10]OEE33556.1 oxidative stress defense protein [Vibrio genomosp. F10 str. ZF-129]OEE94734.1 oxidative stress defense protein [Vibrio genomosp. F10 str. 9ZC157]OEF07249.1 oxidative stress defense protein [Vibrio genomosp. F10 str. 9ZD137]OEF08080.1 oxidative stress defense protein [Vibrio genomosp. F10 str. 9ZB36]